MPQPKRPPGRNHKPTRNKKTTFQKLTRWFLEKIHMTFREVCMGILISILVTAVQPYLTDSFWAGTPRAIKVQYYQL